MRMLSVDPLTAGVPVHCAADGMIIPSPTLYTSCATLHAIVCSAIAPGTQELINPDSRIGRVMFAILQETKYRSSTGASDSEREASG